MVRTKERSEVAVAPRRRRDRARHGRATARALIAAGLALSSAAAFAIEGTVVDRGGKPVPSAQVCYMAGNQVRRCAPTGDDGRFEMPDTPLDTLRVAAEGYRVTTVSVADVGSPIVLLSAPSLLVRLVDAATGEPIEKAEVFVVYPSGREIGPFPVNRAGVRIRRVIQPGKARVRVVAAGYDSGRPHEIELVEGEETEVELRLEPDRSSAGSVKPNP
jgi:hypothetical protein